MCVVCSYRYVLGHDAMRKMGAANVLISGMKGLGIEIGEWSVVWVWACVCVPCDELLLLTYCNGG